MSSYELLPRFQRLFTGMPGAFGTGKGQWIKRVPTPFDWLEHINGENPARGGIGIAPLMPDNCVKFAAIDLDKPDFELAREFQTWLPGRSFVERTRSGNAHVWVFFSGRIEAWVAMGILREALKIEGAPHTEIFPKNHDFSRVSLGNYINLPYYGPERPILDFSGREACDMTLSEFLDEAEQNLNSPDTWRAHARWLMIEDPFLRPKGEQQEFGTQRNLHMCADYVIDGALSGERPIAQGHRSVVYFNLAKQIANCAMWTQEEAFDALVQVRDASDELLNQPLKPTSELRRYLRNAYEKRYTSTGCDDPVFAPYAHPDCPIANPRRP